MADAGTTLGSSKRTAPTFANGSAPVSCRLTIQNQARTGRAKEGSLVGKAENSRVIIEKGDHVIFFPDALAPDDPIA